AVNGSNGFGFVTSAVKFRHAHAAKTDTMFHSGIKTRPRRLAFQNARQLVEERFGRALELIFESPPQQTAVGFRQHCVDAVFENRFLALAREVKAVRAV